MDKQERDRLRALCEAAGIYVASRASLPERPEMWRNFRAAGMPINSSWIDEAGPGETADFRELWDRIENEIARSRGVLLFAKTEDFPLKGALVEAGIALGMGKPVVVCLPGVELEGDSCRPIGSWVRHRMVEREDRVYCAAERLLTMPVASTALPAALDALDAAEEKEARLVEHLSRTQQACAIFERNSADVAEMWERVKAAEAERDALRAKLDAKEAKGVTT